MKRLFIVLLGLASLVASAQYYVPDVLGSGFEQHTFIMADDYKGEVVSTLVRKMSPDTVQRAVLYVHGYNDYFFQTEMAQQFIDNGFNFYAIDLRKYGRSLRPGQWEYEVRDMSEYFADIDSALMVIKREGNSTVVMMGHSTGGLTTSLYCHARKDSNNIDALILNSPFFEWNFNSMYRNVLIPSVAFMGKYFPDWGLPDATRVSPYAMSLLATYNGEWEYNTDWKKSMSRGERFGWIRAIDQGHKQIQNEVDIMCPILLMHSDKTIRGNEWTPDFQCGDAVLDVEHIARYGQGIGRDVTEVTVTDGLHDLFLSRQEVRKEAYRAVFEWLRNKEIISNEDK